MRRCEEIVKGLGGKGLDGHSLIFLLGQVGGSQVLLQYYFNVDKLKEERGSESWESFSFLLHRGSFCSDSGDKTAVCNPTSSTRHRVERYLHSPCQTWMSVFPSHL